MDGLKNEIGKFFGGSIRVRACAIVLQEDKTLLVRHKGLNKENSFWAPPGGGIKFGEYGLDAVKREVKEETGLIITPGQILFTHEHIGLPLHAIEFFYEAQVAGGQLKLGRDPELPTSDQILEAISYFTIMELSKLPNSQKHQCLHNITAFEELFS